MSSTLPDDGPLLTPEQDQTKIVNDDPLIVQADKRLTDDDAVVRAVEQHRQREGLIETKPPCFLYLPKDPNLARTNDIVYIDKYAHCEHVAALGCFSSNPPGPPRQRCFDLQPVEGKGIGMIATRSIDPGELIYRERPVYSSRRDLLVLADQLENGVFNRAALQRLTPDARNSILQLHNAAPPGYDVVRGILKTNCLEIRITELPDTKPGEEFRGCFPMLSRINHACSPTAHYYFNWKTFQGEIRALHVIIPGEEITIAYTDLCLPARERHTRLKDERFMETCICRICSQPPHLLAESDARRLKIHALLERMLPVDSKEMPGNIPVERFREAMSAAEEEGVVYDFSRLLLFGSQLQTLYGSLNLAKEWVARARKLFRESEGKDGYHYVKLGQAMSIHRQMEASGQGPIGV
ncbi:hypothetical protein QCA50_004366 [Cerrena zonata]|uniref:SET domain-containing protein n=1 Tax=Cerrena zonata TaxID=2478898 RepID=A0AAW0GR98_9APHY